jgi:ATP-binding cassette subfamily B (MDR/TAP) protein 1
MNNTPSSPINNDGEVNDVEVLIREDNKEQLNNYLNEATPKSSLRLVIIIGWEWIWILCGMFFSMGSAVVSPIFFWTLGNSFGSLATSTATDIGAVTTELAVNIVYIAIAAGACALLSNFFFTYGSQRVGNKVKQVYFNRVTEQEIGFFDAKKAGALAHSLSEDTSKVTDFFAIYLQSLTTFVSQAIIGFCFAMTASWIMMLLQMSTFPLLLLLNIINRPLLSNLASKVSKLTSVSMGTANEVITSMRTVRSMAGEEKEVERYGKQINTVKKVAIVTAVVRSTTSLLNIFLVYGATALAVWYAGKMLGLQTIAISQFIRVFGLGVLTVTGIIGSLMVLPEIIKSQNAAKNLLKIISREPATKYKGEKTLEEIKGNISFKNVTFRYPTRPGVAVLKNFSLDIKEGTSVALVGQSGSGKSTIVGLLEKWYEAEEGTVELDGVDIKELDPVWLHRHLGIVQQEPVLFATTIKRNITYAIDTINGHIRTAAKKAKISDSKIESMIIPVDHSRIENAAKAANAHDFIMKLPDGYETIIGERGVSLSGGQKQRIAIARAVLQDPKVLLLDEATSALDTKSEALVQHALEKLMVSRTSVVIAHRLTTIQDCDNIVVMRNGLVMETGKHDDLIQNTSGAYYRLASKQMELGNSESSDNLVSSSDTESSTDEIEEISLDNKEKPSPAIESSPIIETYDIPKKSKKKSKTKKVEEFTKEKDIEDPRKPNLRNPFLILKLLGFDLLLLAIGFTGAIAAGSVPILNYYFFGNVVSIATPARNSDGTFIPFPPGYSISDLVSRQAIYIAIAAAGGAIGQCINWFFTILVNDRLGVRLRSLYFKALSKQEMGFYDIKKSGKLLSTLSEGVVSATNGLTLKGALFFQHFGQFIVGVIMAFVASWQTTLIMLAAGIPTIGILIICTSFFVNYYNRRIMRLSASSLGTANEVIGAIRTVRSMSGEEREQRRYAADLKNTETSALRKAIAYSITMGGVQFCKFFLFHDLTI